MSTAASTSIGSGCEEDLGKNKFTGASADIDLPEALPKEADLSPIDTELDDETLSSFGGSWLDIEQDCVKSTGEMSSISSSCVILGVDAQVACSEAASASGSDRASSTGRLWGGAASGSVAGITTGSTAVFRRNFPR
jgi:hypothetical protein